MPDDINSDFIEPDVFSSGNKGTSSTSNNVTSDYSNPFSASGMEATQEGNYIPTDVSPAVKRGTLDESVMETLSKDIRDIMERLKLTFTPILRINITDDEINSLTTSCDMWTPLLFIIFYSLCVSHGKSIFSTLFLFCWSMLFLMGLHLRLIEPTRKISLISYLSLCGYPLSLIALYSLLSQILIPIIIKISSNSTQNMIVRALTFIELITLVGTVFAAIKCTAFITKSKGFVQLFPLGILYLILGWIATVL